MISFIATTEQGMLELPTPESLSDGTVVFEIPPLYMYLMIVDIPCSNVVRTMDVKEAFLSSRIPEDYKIRKIR